jgi:hypothetical protein
LAPSLHEPAAQLEKHRIMDSLNQNIAKRPNFDEFNQSNVTKKAQ